MGKQTAIDKTEIFLNEIKSDQMVCSKEYDNLL